MVTTAVMDAANPASSALDEREAVPERGVLVIGSRVTVDCVIIISERHYRTALRQMHIFSTRRNLANSMSLCG
jgi:hypothetical protein